MSLGTICRCCGEKIQTRASANPNICLSCAQLLEDESPLTLVRENNSRTTDEGKDAEERDRRADFADYEHAGSTKSR